MWYRTADSVRLPPQAERHARLNWYQTVSLYGGVVAAWFAVPVPAPLAGPGEHRLSGIDGGRQAENRCLQSPHARADSGREGAAGPNLQRGGHRVREPSDGVPRGDPQCRDDGRLLDARTAHDVRA